MMKKIGELKILMKNGTKKVDNVVKNINKELKNNSEIIDFFSKIVLAIVSISIAINANKIAEHQQKIDEISVLPNIIVETETEDYDAAINIKNTGAPVYNVNIEYKTLLTCVVNAPKKAIREFIQIPINNYYFDAIKTGDHTQTLASMSCNTITHNFEEFRQYIKNEYEEKDMYSLMKLETMIKLTYKDYLERQYEEYFVVSPYKTRRLSKEEMYDTEEYMNNIVKPIELNFSYYDKIIEIYEYFLNKSL